MTVEETLKKYDLFDNAIWCHGFTDHLRDYQIIAGLRYAESEGDYSFLFRGCVEANYTVTLPEGAFSMDDALIDPERARADDAPFGFIWDLRYADVYPGWRYISDSPRAAEWSKRVTLPMHEVVIETNVYKLSLVFHDLIVEKIQDLGQCGV